MKSTWAPMKSQSARAKYQLVLASPAKSAVKLMVASEEVSSFGSKTFKRRIEAPSSIDDKENQTLSEASNSSEATMVISNKSKANSRTSTLTMETFEMMAADGMAQSMKKLIKLLSEQCESNKNERELDKKEAAANRAELLCQRKRDKQEFLELQAHVLTQESPQRCTHQLTDAAAHNDSYTPTGRQPHGGDATSTKKATRAGSAEVCRPGIRRATNTSPGESGQL